MSGDEKGDEDGTAGERRRVSLFSGRGYETLRRCMYSSTSRLVAAVVMTLTVTACGDGNGAIPTATAPTPTPAPGSTFALFGVVSEVTVNGIVPVEGVLLDVASCDASARSGCAFDKRATTNAQGAYIVEGVYPGPAGVWVDKTGFQLPEGVRVDGEGVQTVMVKGDTQFDIQLVRR